MAGNEISRIKNGKQCPIPTLAPKNAFPHQNCNQNWHLAMHFSTFIFFCGFQMPDSVQGTTQEQPRNNSGLLLGCSWDPKPRILGLRIVPGIVPGLRNFALERAWALTVENKLADFTEKPRVGSNPAARLGFRAWGLGFRV